MNPINQQLYQIFSRKDVKTLPWEMMQEPPQLHDVFRVNREKYDWYMDVSDFRLRQTQWWMPLWQEVPYNPTLPLLSQSDDTKSAILSLFK